MFLLSFKKKKKKKIHYYREEKILKNIMEIKYNNGLKKIVNK